VGGLDDLGSGLTGEGLKPVDAELGAGAGEGSLYSTRIENQYWGPLVGLGKLKSSLTRGGSCDGEARGHGAGSGGEGGSVLGKGAAKVCLQAGGV
jgi:hypothetical protein